MGGWGRFNGGSMELTSIAVCFALQEEAGAFKKLCGDKVPVFFTGIGRENATRTVREFLASHKPGLLFTCGFAGGLIPELKIGDVVFQIPSGGNDYAAVRSALTEAGAKAVKIACVDRIATTAKEKKAVREQTGADVAEMESGAVQEFCAGAGVRCVTVRVISDGANDDLPLDFNKFLKEDKSVDMSKLMMAVAKAPWKMGALMQLQQNTKLAAQKLAEVLVKVIG
jgi:adenosylhomocysteine nucleosidase